jgi:PiT family inorganic phosphate transporter
LLGGYAGAAMTHSAMLNGIHALYDPIIVVGWSMTLLFIVIAPALGMALGHGLMKLVMHFQRRMNPKKADKVFGRMQLFSSAFLSLMHGSNDAQKTAGIIAGVLATAGVYDHFTIPFWVLGCSYGTMALGTLAGGWRIVNTMGRRLTRLRPGGGFAAETSSAFAILLATLLQLPVSTTHATTGAILGTGSARSLKSVRWNLAGHIMWAWVLTIPAAALIGALAMAAITRFGG